MTFTCLIIIWNISSNIVYNNFSIIFKEKEAEMLFLRVSDLLSVRIITGMDRNHTGMDRNAPEWASITRMDIKINLFYAIKFIILP